MTETGPYVVLARRYRPQTFHEVLGQESTARTLVHAIETGRIAHSYIFAGPRGIGKTSMARILAKALCCSRADGPTPTPCGECEICIDVARGDDLDVIEIDGASNRGIDEVRTLRENARFSPARARFKIYIIDEVHMLTEQAFNALLKILEEPPPHVKFIFATTEAHKVPATILSRCQRFDFRRIPTRTIAAHLESLCRAEGVEADDDVLLAVAHFSAGGMRDAQSVLDQLILLGEGKIRAKDLEQLLGTVSTGRLEALVNAISKGSEAEALSIHQEIHDLGIDPAEFLSQAIETLRSMMVLLACGEETDLLDLTAEVQISLSAAAKRWGLARVLYGMGLLTETLKSVKLVGEGRALTDLALVKLARSEGLRSLDDIVADLRDLEGKVGRPGIAAARAPAGAEIRRRGEDPALFEGAQDYEGALRGEESVRLTLDRVRAAWGEVLSRVKQESSAAGSFLESGTVSGLTDDAVTVAFPPSARFQRKHLGDADHIRLIEAELQEVLGSALRLETIEDDEPVPEQIEPGTGPDPAEPVTHSEIERIRKEPIVNLLKNLFMARLIHIERT